MEIINNKPHQVIHKQSKVPVLIPSTDEFICKLTHTPLLSVSKGGPGPHSLLSPKTMHLLVLVSVLPHQIVGFLATYLFLSLGY